MAYQDPANPDPNDDGGQPGQVTLSRDQIRSMERDAKEARAAKRELAFVKAGIDTDSALGKLFFTAYEGALETEAIQAAWKDIAPAPPAPPAGDPPPPDPDPGPGAQDFAAERDRIANGGSADDGAPPPERDPRKVAIEDGIRLMAEGKSRDEAMADAFSTLAGAAASGDPRVIYNPGA